MSFRHRPGQRGLTQAIEHLLVAIILMAQGMTLIAPLLDVHSPTPVASTIVLPSGSGAGLDAPSIPVEQHDPLTCPACIAQSLVASLPDSPPHAPTAAIASGHELVQREVFLQSESVLHHNPRGPPLIG